MGNIVSYYAIPHPPIIIPEVGQGEEKKIKKISDACSQVANEIAKSQPDTIIVITPHGPLFSDAVSISAEESIVGNLGKFGVPQIELDLDINIPLTKEIVNQSKNDNIFAVEITSRYARQYGIKYELDHGVIIPLHFVNQQYTNYQIVHITYGMMPKLQLYRFGMCIKKAVENSDTNAVFIASGDLSHHLANTGPYDYNPYGEKFDKEITSLLSNGDVLGVFNMDDAMIEEAGECGLRSFYIMLGAMNGYNIKGNLLAYEGPFGVGYGVMSFSTENSNQDAYKQLIEEKEKRMTQKLQHEDAYVKLARKSLFYFLNCGKYLEVTDDLIVDIEKGKKGVFVSLKKEGQLRGCIGTILPTTNSVGEEIIRNAVEAGQYDPRFLPVKEDELDDLDISVDVLTEPQKASQEELDPKKYGVIVRKGTKSGLLLPDLEGVDTVEKQLDIALQKGGISANEDFEIEKFEVIRHQ